MHYLIQTMSLAYISLRKQVILWSQPHGTPIYSPILKWLKK